VTTVNGNAGRFAIVEARHNLRNVTDEWITRIEEADRRLRETRAMATVRIQEAQHLLDRARGGLTDSSDPE